VVDVAFEAEAERLHVRVTQLVVEVLLLVAPEVELQGLGFVQVLQLRVPDAPHNHFIELYFVV